MHVHGFITCVCGAFLWFMWSGSVTQSAGFAIRQHVKSDPAVSNLFSRLTAWELHFQLRVCEYDLHPHLLCLMRRWGCVRIWRHDEEHVSIWHRVKKKEPRLRWPPSASQICCINFNRVLRISNIIGAVAQTVFAEGLSSSYEILQWLKQDKSAWFLETGIYKYQNVCVWGQAPANLGTYLALILTSGGDAAVQAWNLAAYIILYLLPYQTFPSRKAQSRKFIKSSNEFIFGGIQESDAGKYKWHKIHLHALF